MAATSSRWHLANCRPSAAAAASRAAASPVSARAASAAASAFVAFEGRFPSAAASRTRAAPRRRRAPRPVRVGLDRVVPARRGPAVRRVDRVAQALATGVVDGRGREPLVAQQPRGAAERRRGDRLVLVDGEHAARGERRRRALVRDLQLPPGDDRVHELDDGLAHLRRAVGRVARDALDHLRHQGAVAAVRAELHEERDLRGLLVLVRRGGGLVEDRPRLAVDGLHCCSQRGRSARQCAPPHWGLATQSVLGEHWRPASARLAPSDWNPALKAQAPAHVAITCARDRASRARATSTAITAG